MKHLITAGSSATETIHIAFLCIAPDIDPPMPFPFPTRNTNESSREEINKNMRRVTRSMVVATSDALSSSAAAATARELAPAARRSLSSKPSLHVTPRSAIVYGGAGQLGNEVIRALSREGWHTVSVDLR